MSDPTDPESMSDTELLARAMGDIGHLATRISIITDRSEVVADATLQVAVLGFIAIGFSREEVMELAGKAHDLHAERVHEGPRPSGSPCHGCPRPVGLARPQPQLMRKVLLWLAIAALLTSALQFIAPDKLPLVGGRGAVVPGPARRRQGRQRPPEVPAARRDKGRPQGPAFGLAASTRRLGVGQKA